MICCLHTPYKTWGNKKHFKNQTACASKILQSNFLIIHLLCVSSASWGSKRTDAGLKKDKGRWNIRRNRRKKQENTNFYNGVCTLTAPRYWGYWAVPALGHQVAVFCSLRLWTAVCRAAVFSTEFPEESYSTHRFLLKQPQSSITSCELWVRHTHQSGAERVKVVCIADGRFNIANSSALCKTTAVWKQSTNWETEQTCFEMNGLWTALVSIVTQCVFIGPASNNTARKKMS